MKINRLFILGLAFLLLVPIGAFGALKDNLTSYYSFDVVGSEFNDLQGWANLLNGANSNTTNTTGIIASARDDSGLTTNYILTASDAKLISASTSGYSAATNRGYSFQVWVKYDTIGAPSDPFGGNLGTAGGTYNPGYVRASTTQTSNGVRRGPGDGETVNTSAHVTGQWYHYVMVIDYVSNYYVLFKNGTIISNTSSVGTGAAVANNSIVLGGRTLTFDGQIDEVAFWNRTLTASEVSQLYNGGAGLSFSQINTSIATNASILASDFYTNQSLSNINVYENNTILCQTTNGTCNLPYLTNTSSLYNLVINATDNGGYFNLSRPSQNVSGTMNFRMSQSVYNFTATQYISNATISAVSFSTNYITNDTHYFRAGTYLVNASKASYFTKQQNVTAVALTSTSVVIENMTNTRLNLTVRNAITSAIVTTYSVQLNISAYGHSQNASTTTGAVVVDAVSGNWTALVDASGYALTLSNLTLVPGVNNLTVYIYTSESVNFFFYNEQTGALITNPNVTIELIGSFASYNRTTNGTGTTYIDLVTPDAYVARYYATGYSARFGYVTITSRSTQNVSLYLLSTLNGTNVTATVFQPDGRTVANALVKVLKYDLASNSYIVREQLLSDFEGRVIFDVQFNMEFYKFIVESPIGTVALTTNPAYITSTEFPLILTGTVSGTEYQYVLGAGGVVSYNPTTSNFRFDWSDSMNMVTQACVYAYRLQDNYTGLFLNSSCSSSSSGSLLVYVNNVSGYQYFARGYLTIGGVQYFVDEDWADLRNSTDFGKLGLVIAAMLTIGISFIFLTTPTSFVLSIPIGFTLTQLTNITYFSSWVTVAVWVVCIIIVFSMGRAR